MDTKALVRAIAKTAKDYNRKAAQAISQRGSLYLPGYLDLETFVGLVRGSHTLACEGENAGEPVYTSRQEGLIGRNADGSLHGGFIIIDPRTEQVLRVEDRDGTPSFDHIITEIVSATYSGYEIKVETKKNGRFEIRTKYGIRGWSSVEVFVTNEHFLVLMDGNPVPIQSIRKVSA